MDDEDGLYCPKCNSRSFSETDKYCGKCGVKLKFQSNKCPLCNYDRGVEKERFCKGCGLDLEGYKEHDFAMYLLAFLFVSLCALKVVSYFINASYVNVFLWCWLLVNSGFATVCFGMLLTDKRVTFSTKNRLKFAGITVALFGLVNFVK